MMKYFLVTYDFEDANNEYRKIENHFKHYSNSHKTKLTTTWLIETKYGCHEVYKNIYRFIHRYITREFDLLVIEITNKGNASDSADQYWIDNIP